MKKSTPSKKTAQKSSKKSTNGKYKFKLTGLFGNIKPADAANELTRIEHAYGRITPEIVVNESKDPDSVLHNYFEWNNQKAAEKHRLQQARVLINNIEIVVISSGKTKQVGAYEIITTSQGSTYKNVETLTADDIEQVRANTALKLAVIQNKLNFYNRLKPAAKQVGRAIRLLR